MTEYSSPPELRTFDWLTLERIPGVGPITIARLIKAFGNPRSAMEACFEDIRLRAGLSEKTARNIVQFRPPDADILRDIKILEDLNTGVVTRWDLDYPENLTEIYDPPALLFVRGSVMPSDRRSVAVVGTRNPSRYGLEMTESITRDLVHAGITIVSGLARGIDTACHRSALKAGGRTIGVLGCGIDVCYPRENKSLVEEMIEHGAVISEFRPGIRPLATNFYRRNRIVSGLTKGTLVVEAAPKSGSLITAAHALDQNREVFALPGSILNKRSWGPHHLLKQGAALVESANDIVATLFEPISTRPPMRPHTTQEDIEGLSEIARSVLDSIDLDPVPIDSLCMSLKIDAGKLAGLLLELELRGLIKQHPGKMFSKTL
jgi:DNA processing protein